jgi:TrmH family RNA methyltransferase
MSLHQKKNRMETGLFVAEGRKIVEELLTSSLDLEAIYTAEPFDTARCPVYLGTQEDLRRMSALSTAPGILAIAAMRTPVFTSPGRGMMLALDNIQDPGNLGTLVRTAEWFGYTHCLCSRGSADVWNGKVIQSGMGAVFRLPVSYVSLEETLGKMMASGVPVFAGQFGGTPYRNFTVPSSGVVLIGSESHGISPSMMQLPLTPVTIPGTGVTESLNAAVAGGILMAHFSA